MRRPQLIFLSLAFALLGARAQAQSDVVVADAIAAVVNDLPVTRQQIEMAIGPGGEDSIYRQYQDRPDVLRRNLLKLRADTTEILINRAVILHDFKSSIKVPDSLLDDFVQDRINELIKDKYHDEAGLTRELDSEGLTREEFKQKIREQFIIEQMRLKFVPQPIISPRKIEDYYVAHRDDFKVEDQVRMRMIVINKNSFDSDEQTRKRAEEILSQVKSGASFAELARSYSDGSTAQDGGETGWEDLSIVNKTLADEISKLKPGQYTGVIDTPRSFYILLLEDRHSEHFKSLNDVRLQIEKILSAQETDRLQKVWMDRLRNKTFIKYF